MILISELVNMPNVGSPKSLAAGAPTHGDSICVNNIAFPPFIFTARGMTISEFRATLLMRFHIGEFLPIHYLYGSIQ